MVSSPWQRVLDLPEDGHLVQFYGADEDLLAFNVTRYLREGLRARDGAVVIATPQHIQMFAARLDHRNRVEWLDAQQTLDSFMVDRMPVWELFEAAIVPVIQRVRSVANGVRAYGEMVGLLWSEGRHLAAVRLEHFWNRLLSRSPIHLYCGYPIDIFSRAFDPASVDALLCSHTHIVPAGGAKMEAALCRAMEEVLGSDAQSIESQMKTELFRARWGVLPRSEGLILWLRRNRACPGFGQAGRERGDRIPWCLAVEQRLALRPDLKAADFGL